MAYIPRLQRQARSGIYYCRVVVPKDLIEVIKKREITVSLRTTDLKLAKQRFIIESFKIDQRFAALRGLPVFDLVLPNAETGKRALPVVESITLTDLITRYFAAHEQQSHSPKTKLEYNIRFNTIKQVMGDYRPIASITREDCRQFQQLMMKLPPNVNKRFPKMTLQEVADHAKKEKLPLMAPKTINQHLSCLNLLMDWACKERLIDANPARGLFVRETVQRKDKRDPFSIEQLNQILGSGLMSYYKSENSERYWIPLIALWTGARLNEICQLRIQDVEIREGIYCFLIHENDGNRLKTVNASEVSVRGFNFDALGYLPVDNAGRLELIGTLGISHLKAEYNIPTVGSTDDTETKPRFGAGAQYWLTDNLNVRGLVRYQGADFEDSVKNAVTANLGLNFQF